MAMITLQKKRYLEYLATKGKAVAEGRLTRAKYKSDVARYKKVFGTR